MKHLAKIYAYVFSVWIPCPNCGGHGKTRFNVAGQIFANDFDHLVVQMVQMGQMAYVQMGSDGV